MDVKRYGCCLEEHTTVGRLRMEVESFYKWKVLLTFPSVGAEAMGDWQAMCGHRQLTRGSRKASPQGGGRSTNPNTHSCVKTANLSGQFVLPSNENTAQSGS